VYYFPRAIETVVKIELPLSAANFSAIRAPRTRARSMSSGSKEIADTRGVRATAVLFRKARQIVAWLNPDSRDLSQRKL